LEANGDVLDVRGDIGITGKPGNESCSRVQ